MKTLYSTPFSRGGVEAGLIYESALRPYLRLGGAYIQALHELFQEVLHRLPGVDAVGLVAHHHHVYVGRAGCGGEMEGTESRGAVRIRTACTCDGAARRGGLGRHAGNRPPLWCADLAPSHLLCTAGEKLAERWKSGLTSEHTPVA